MGRKRARIYEQEHEGPSLAQRQAVIDRAEETGPVAGEVQRLQRGAGNEAVSAMLVQRDGPVAQDAKSGEDKAVTSTAVFDDPVGMLPLLSFSKAQSGGEYQISVPSSAQDTVIFASSNKGTKFATVVISTRDYNLTLNDVYISSVNYSGSGGDRTVTMTLNYAAEHFGTAGASKPSQLD